MPKNKQAMVRYQIIDRCLRRRGRRQWTTVTLAEACCRELEKQGLLPGAEGPKPRTIQQDITDMRSGKLGQAAPILFDSRLNSYRYTDPDFVWQGNLPLDREEVGELRQAVALLEQVALLPQADEMRDLIVRLENALDMQVQQQPPVVLLDGNPEATGLRWLRPLYRHTRQRECLQLTYQPFTEPQPDTHIVSPYLLREYNNRWFLLAFHHRERLIWTFALDRILHLEPHLLQPFEPDPSFQAQSWFRHLIGVTRLLEHPPERILLRVDLPRARYIETKPLHPSQEITETTPGYLTFRYFLIPNPELESQIFSFGEAAEILEPPWLRDRLAKRAHKLYTRYRN